MADANPGGQEGEEFEEESPFIRAEHDAYKPINIALKKQLSGENEKVTLLLAEKTEELRKLEKNRQEIGVTLYEAQQQLAKLQVQLEQLHDKYAMVRSQREEDEENAAKAKGTLKGKLEKVDEATKRLAKSRDELNQLNITLRKVEEYNEQMKAEIQVSRRATYKHDDQIKQIEVLKHKQDILIDGMNEDIKRMTEEKALLDSQLIAQKQETDAAVATLREAAKEMEAIEFEKKQLLLQWRSSIHGIERRD
jgi:chromosome segregation ATPase